MSHLLLRSVASVTSSLFICRDFARTFLLTEVIKPGQLQKQFSRYWTWPTLCEAKTIKIRGLPRYYLKKQIPSDLEKPSGFKQYLTSAASKEEEGGNSMNNSIGEQWAGRELELVKVRRTKNEDQFPDTHKCLPFFLLPGKFSFSVFSQEKSPPKIRRPPASRTGAPLHGNQEQKCRPASCYTNQIPTFKRLSQG